ncbi:uncharacterized protein LOC134746270 [Cydia strobilella]|uniref:uncharacterized protein LOC134746270 n=1 Tax=Cydia strobilella TaxID=1100964 RepID=UPI0030075DC6
MHENANHSVYDAVKCAGCDDPLYINEKLDCSKCHLAFHYQCCRIDELQFNNLTFTQKAGWICPNCYGSARKGENQNTPIRNQFMLEAAAQLTDVDMKTPVSWVTQRQRSNKEHADQSQSRLLYQSGNRSHQCLTKEDVRDVVCTELRNILSEEITKVLNRSVSAHLQDVKAEITGLKEEIGKVKDSMDFINLQFEDIKKDTHHTSQECKRLTREVEVLQATNTELNQRITQIEQHSRACNVEIQCLPEHRSENLVTVIMQLAKTVSCDIKEDDIHHCTRTAKLDAASSRPRSVVVQMKSPITRDRLLASVIKFNKTHKDDKLNSSHLGLGGDKVPIYVAEHLSPYNRELHKAARKAAKDKNYKFVWVRSGRIFIRKDETSQAIVLKDLSSISRLL